MIRAALAIVSVVGEIPWESSDVAIFSEHELKDLCGVPHHPDDQEKNPEPKMSHKEFPPMGEIPGEYDVTVAYAHRHGDGCFKVHNQRGCGSCWAVSTVGSIEDRLCIAGMNKSLSAADLVSCCTDCAGGHHGCNGGWPSAAWAYYKSHGIVDGKFHEDAGFEGTCLPYPQRPNRSTLQCRRRCGNGHSYRQSQFHLHTSDRPQSIRGEANMMKELFLYGPFTVCIEIMSDFNHYRGGVYYHRNGGSVGGHAVELVGYGYEPKQSMNYWRIKNSWGEGWGEHGFFRIRRGTNEIKVETFCGAAASVGADPLPVNYPAKPTPTDAPTDAPTTTTSAPEEPVSCQHYAAYNQMMCVDGTVCNVKEGEKWACCDSHGGRAQCPKNYRFMCASASGCKGNYCCATQEEKCASHGGLRTDCPVDAQGPACSDSGKDFIMLCNNGSECSVRAPEISAFEDKNGEYGWHCCSGRGGRAACPKNYGFMCANAKSCHGDNCCSPSSEGCASFGGLLSCSSINSLPEGNVTMMTNSLRSNHSQSNSQQDPVLESCSTSGSPVLMECNSGKFCNPDTAKHDCCEDTCPGGIKACPTSWPVLCNFGICVYHEEDCKGHGGVKQCHNAAVFGNMDHPQRRLEEAHPKPWSHCGQGAHCDGMESADISV